jgi:TolB-like protein
MSKLRLLMFAFMLILLPILAGAAAVPPDEGDGGAPERLTVTAADFTGADKELGRFLTDTLLTDLAQSTQLQPLERATTEQAFEKLHLPSDRPLTAPEARRLGEAAEAQRILVGSFLQHDGQVTINARMLDAKTGLVIPGGAMNVTGDRRSLLSLTHRLASQLHKKLTGVDLVLEEEPAHESTHEAHLDPAAVDPPPAPAVPTDDLAALRQSGLIPPTAHANSALSDHDLSVLVHNVGQRVALQSDSALTLTQAGPVTRIRALAALVKLMVASDDLANYRAAPPDHMPSDMAQVPAWGVPYVAAAVDQGWWHADRALNAKEPATWSFVATLLTRLPLHDEPSHDGDSHDGPAHHEEEEPVATSLPDQDKAPYTGLVVDALNFNVVRAMGPRILDEDGHVVYPDPGHVPSTDYIEDHGMVSYYGSLEAAKRAGKHPLVIHALKVSEVGHDDIIFSNEAAELIREANRRGKFLWKWNVAVLGGTGQPAPVQDQQARQDGSQ